MRVINSIIPPLHYRVIFYFNGWLINKKNSHTYYAMNIILCCFTSHGDVMANIKLSKRARKTVSSYTTFL